MGGFLYDKKEKPRWSTKKERAQLRRKIRLQLQPRSQTAAVLRHLADMYGVLNRPGRYASLAEYTHVRKERAFWQQYKTELQALERLRKRRFAQVEKRKDGYYVAITATGKVETLKLDIRLCKKQLHLGWVCLVLFDIPETAQDVRVSFRTFVRHSGFTILQKSAWSSSKDVGGKMQEFVHLLGIEKWVRIFIAREEPWLY